MVYTVMFKDKSFWQIIMNDEDLKIFKNFKKNLDKEK